MPPESAPQPAKSLNGRPGLSSLPGRYRPRVNLGDLVPLGEPDVVLAGKLHLDVKIYQYTQSEWLWMDWY